MWRFLMRCFRISARWSLIFIVFYLPFCLSRIRCFFFRHRRANSIIFSALIEWENGEQEKIAVNNKKWNNEVKFILALSVLYAAFYNRIMILLIFIELLWQPLNLTRHFAIIIWSLLSEKWCNLKVCSKPSRKGLNLHKT